ncbi:MAG: EVE domain-containing protein, partial [Terriglobales bacterium]
VDPTQFDRKSPYYDAKSPRAAPRWYCVEVRALRKTRLMSIAEMRGERALKQMWTLRPGNRLSITPVSAAEWTFICERLR